MTKEDWKLTCENLGGQTGDGADRCIFEKEKVEKLQEQKMNRQTLNSLLQHWSKKDWLMLSSFFVNLVLIVFCGFLIWQQSFSLYFSPYDTKIVFFDSARDELNSLFEEYFPYEFGACLEGYYDGKKYVITGVGEVSSDLSKVQTSVPKGCYFANIHSHPNARAIPSPEDIGYWDHCKDSDLFVIMGGKNDFAAFERSNLFPQRV